MTKICEVCTSEFYVKPWEFNNRYCCSKVCGYKRLTKYKMGVDSDKDYQGITRKERQHDYRLSIRKIVIHTLGDKCVKCGYDDMRALQVDHIDGGGRQERREIPNTTKFYKCVIDSFNNNENKYQLLCANCNVIKRIENKEHKK